MKASEARKAAMENMDKIINYDVMRLEKYIYEDIKNSILIGSFKCTVNTKQYKYQAIEKVISKLQANGFNIYKLDSDNISIWW